MQAVQPTIWNFPNLDIHFMLVLCILVSMCCTGGRRGTLCCFIKRKVNPCRRLKAAGHTIDKLAAFDLSQHGDITVTRLHMQTTPNDYESFGAHNLS